MIAKYQKRPAEELYDVREDPHCLVNLIGDSKLAAIRTDLSKQLDTWMKSQGDKGTATEEIAHTRKAGFQKRQQKSPKRKNR